MHVYRRDPATPWCRFLEIWLESVMSMPFQAPLQSTWPLVPKDLILEPCRHLLIIHEASLPYCLAPAMTSFPLRISSRKIKCLPHRFQGNSRRRAFQQCTVEAARRVRCLRIFNKPTKWWYTSIQRHGTNIRSYSRISSRYDRRQERRLCGDRAAVFFQPVISCTGRRKPFLQEYGRCSWRACPWACTGC